MFCPYCGSEIKGKVKFCYNCGEQLEFANAQDEVVVKTEEKQQETKVGADAIEPISTIKENVVIDEQTVEEEVPFFNEIKTAEQEAKRHEKENKDATMCRSKKDAGDGSVENKLFADELIQKVRGYWDGLDTFCKATTVGIGTGVCFLLLALLSLKILAICISLLQITIGVLAMLVHKEIIKCNLKWIKYILLLVMFLVTILDMRSFSYIRVSTPYSAEKCIGKMQTDVEYDFREAGFSNITEEIITDLELIEIDKVGVVDSVSINGITDFGGNDAFDSNAKVVISYRDLKNINTPYGADEVTSINENTLLGIFEQAGFTNIVTEEKYDLDPDETEAEFENEVIINGSIWYDKNDEFPLDAEVEIVTHRRYEKCTLKLELEFISNLIFSTYDVEMSIGDEIETLKHGEDGSFEYRLAPDEYTITFTNMESDSVTGSVAVDVQGDTNASYKIRCYNDEIKVETMYVESLSLIGENDVMVSASAFDYKYENYVDVEKTLRDAGFTNIETKILYDIVWGWTEEGEVESVTIAGSDDFKRGNIFDKNVPIVITYHMWEDDNPNKQIETESEDLGNEKNGITMTSDSSTYAGMMRTEIEQEFKEKGFENIVIHEVNTTDSSKIDGQVTAVSAKKDSFNRGDVFSSDDEIIIYCWKVEIATSNIVFPASNSKLGKDFDSKSATAAYYINVDGTKNKPSLEIWNGATVTDCVAEYLEYLKGLGFTVTVIDTTEREIYPGYHTYDTNFKVSSADVTWTMSLYIQSEKYVEYELDIHLN